MTSSFVIKVGAGAVLCALLAGCTVGPNYKRPVVSVPDVFPRTTPENAAITESLASEKWWDAFPDEQLQTLIRTALKQNIDLRIAALRVLEAQAQVGIAQGEAYPGAAAFAQTSDGRSAKSKSAVASRSTLHQLGVGFQWNLDFWGRYRRATEAARAELLAKDWAQHAVVGSLVANVAIAYVELRTLDLQLDIAKRTLASNQDSLQLTQMLADGGSTSLLDVRQAEQLVYNATGTISTLDRRIQQQEDLLSTLLGENPGDIVRGLALTDQPHAPVVPPGLPSSLLEYRPDIRQAEAELMAANARIGIAKAAYFPAISLTGSGGLASAALKDLFGGPAGAWSFVGALAEPLYTGGTLRNRVRISEAQRDEAVLAYQQTIQEAFRDVSDTLIAYSSDQRTRQQQELLVRSAEDATRLSNLRYQGGATSYLEVLDTNTRYFSAQLTLAQAELNEMIDYISLYHVLGGGWEQ